MHPRPGESHILLVRHGQSIPLVEGTSFPLVDGHGDPPLSPRGEWQAIQVGERLRHEPIAAIYASNLQRTQQTAAPLAGHLGLPVTIEPDLREVFLGEYEGGLFRQKAADDDDAVLAFREQLDWGLIPGAESNEDLRLRTSAAVLGIAVRHPDQVVAVVCHGGVIASLCGHATQINPFTFAGVRNTSITSMHISADRWKIQSFNDGSHVGPFTHDLDPPADQPE